MKAHILIVDDEPRLAQSLAMALEDEDYDVTITTNGIEALKKVWAAPYPDLVLLDWNMPRLSGLEVCQRLRQAGYEHPVVFVTGMGDRTYQETGLNAGANAYLVKPFTDDKVITTVETLLSSNCPQVA